MNLFCRSLLAASLLGGLCACSGSGVEMRSAIVPSLMRDQARLLGLLDARAEVPSLSVDLRYATAQNCVGRPLYPKDMPCLLRPTTLRRVRQAQAALQAQGYGLRIWDAWRPPEVQQLLYQHGGESGLFLNPHSGWSRHCGGVSLDATLVDREGREMKMPTGFDERPDGHRHGTAAQAGESTEHMRILHRAMVKAGLIPLPGEWWHFDDKDFLENPVPVVWGRQVGLRPKGDRLTDTTVKDAYGTEMLRASANAAP
jgi:zinc D-Ala-D-Ala dipeptidase